MRNAEKFRLMCPLVPAKKKVRYKLERPTPQRQGPAATSAPTGPGRSAPRPKRIKVIVKRKVAKPSHDRKAWRHHHAKIHLDRPIAVGRHELAAMPVLWRAVCVVSLVVATHEQVRLRPGHQVTTYICSGLTTRVSCGPPLLLKCASRGHLRCRSYDLRFRSRSI